MDGPYRSTKIRGGVALPRRGLAWWQGAVGLGAATWLLVIRALVVGEEHGGSVFPVHRPFFFGLGCVAIVVIGAMATMMTSALSAE